MRFYSRITRKPESIITEVKDGKKVVSRERLCTFVNGVCDVSDPKVIARLKEHPNKYRTDKPWPTDHWQDTEEGKELLARGKELNIDVRHIRKEYLIQMIKLTEKEKGIVGSKVKAKVLGYQELIAKAKTLGIPTHKVKKEDLLKSIKEKEVIKV